MARDFSVLQIIQSGSAAQPTFHLVSTRSFPLYLKWPRHEADHSPMSSVKFRNEWSYSATPLCAFLVCTGTALLTVCKYAIEH